MTKFLEVIGHWNDRKSEADTFCVGVAIVDPTLSNEKFDALLDMDNVFFVFTEGTPLLTDHGEFTLTAIA